MSKIKHYGEWPKKIDMQWGAVLYVRKRPKVNSIKFHDGLMDLKLKGGFMLQIDYSGIPSMANATMQQLNNWEQWEGGTLCWPDIDEHLDLINFFGKYC